MKLYEYAVIFPGEKNKEGGWARHPEIVLAPTHVLAKDEDTAAMIAARAIPEPWADSLDRLQVAVRPF